MSFSCNINEIGSRFSLDNIDLDPPKVIVRETGLEDRVMDGEWYLDDEDEEASFESFCDNNTQWYFIFDLPVTLISSLNYSSNTCGSEPS